MKTWYDIQVWSGKKFDGSIQLQGHYGFNELKQTALKTILNKSENKYQSVARVFENKGIGHRAKKVLEVSF